MPPQQSDRLLDLGDDGFDFGTHGIRNQGSNGSNMGFQLWKSNHSAPAALAIPDI
jgi:hypothetical protein